MFAFLMRFGDILDRFNIHKAQEVSLHHRTAFEYWKGCSDTFQASQEYYDSVERELRNVVLPRIGHSARALDAGCGNGRFTLLLASAADHVDACDVSHHLISQARRAAFASGVRNLRFSVKDIAFLKPREANYDCICCMGVLSTLIDDQVFVRVVQNLARGVKRNGFVILRETLSSSVDGQLVVSESYAIRYRNETSYRKTLAEAGLRLEYEVPLLQADSLVNRLFLYRAVESRSL